MPFPNKETQFSGDFAVEAQKKSAEARKRNHERRKAFKEILDDEFEKQVRINGDSDKQISRKEATVLRLMQILMSPQTQEKDFLKAMEFARDTIGEKPIDKVVVADINQETIDEVEAMVSGRAPQTAPAPEVDASGKIQKVDRETGEIVASYKTVAEAARQNGIDRSNLAKAIKAGRAMAGFLWFKRG